MKTTCALLFLALLAPGCSHRAVKLTDDAGTGTPHADAKPADFRAPQDSSMYKPDAVPPPPTWVMFVGGWISSISDMDTDEQGDLMLVGRFNTDSIFGDITLGSLNNKNEESPSDKFYAVKVSASGKALWALSDPGPPVNKIIASGIALDRDDNAYVTGHIPTPGPNYSQIQRLHVSKLSPDGDAVWNATSEGDGNCYGDSVAVDEQGSVYVAGDFDGTVTLGDVAVTSGVVGDRFIAKLSPAGKFLWVVPMSGCRLNGLDVDAEGNSFVTGSFRDPFELGGTTLTSKGGTDIWVAKLSAAGQVLWAISAGGSATHWPALWGTQDTGEDLAADHLGNVYITGSFYQQASFGDLSLESKESDSDLFVAKISADGRFLWAKSGGGPGFDSGDSIAVDAHGNAFVAGLVQQEALFDDLQVSSLGESDALVLKISDDGHFLWATSGGGPHNDYARLIATGSHDTIYAQGSFQKSAIFDGVGIINISEGLTNSGIFVWRVLPR